MFYRFWRSALLRFRLQQRAALRRQKLFRIWLVYRSTMQSDHRIWTSGVCAYLAECRSLRIRGGAATIPWLSLVTVTHQISILSLFNCNICENCDAESNGELSCSIFHHKIIIIVTERTTWSLKLGASLIGDFLVIHRDWRLTMDLLINAKLYCPNHIAVPMYYHGRK